MRLEHEKGKVVKVSIRKTEQRELRGGRSREGE